ncbi:MAG: PIN domain-containing protein [Balneolaceae bacterium]|nr:PIN domain-containing protein [Balneolaceae bacterium]
MKILFDTNILLDVFLEREPFYDSSFTSVAIAERNVIEGWLSGTTVTTLYYLLQKGLSKKSADKHLKNILKVFHIAPVNRAVLEDAITGKFTDYEDSVLHQVAIHSGLDGILTRNQKDFKNCTLPVYSPQELLNSLDALS